MPFAVNDLEKELLRRGVVVATAATVLNGMTACKSWTCSGCKKGKLLLTRRLNKEGGISPAFFLCDDCGVEFEIYPDRTGGVQPRLKGIKEEMYRASFDKNDGGWR